ncbi:vitamin-D-receptor interacting mediator subunit 4-domain-containing protein [Phaeosphaeriaceae sp. PMI808]|nr:vitamin-D-receptor interacting mediator subunit 4-domain-containing protein [Phaeosphaeriaceae sp. PMI808]
MEVILGSQFDRVEKALSTLVDSIAAFNPSPQAAIDLVAADDHLSQGLDQRKSPCNTYRLARHQANHARIQSLRAEAEALKEQLKSSVTSLASLRHDLFETPATALPVDAQPVPVNELLQYAKNISHHTVPPTYRERAPQTGSDKDQDKEDAASSGAPTNGVSTPANALDIMDVIKSTAEEPQEGQVPNSGPAEITAEEEEWLKKLNDSKIAWYPWPSDDKIRTGNLYKLMYWQAKGKDPDNFNIYAYEETEKNKNISTEEKPEASQVEAQIPETQVQQPSVPRPAVIPSQERETFDAFDDLDDEAGIRDAWCKRGRWDLTLNLGPIHHNINRSTTMNAFQKQNNVENRLCTALNNAIHAWEANQLRDIVIIEPEYPPDHQELIKSLQTSFPENDSSSEQRLEQLIKRVVSETAESEDNEGRPVQSWGSMVTFLIGWMAFLRDVDPNNLLQVYQRLNELLQQANSALQHPTKGILMLPTIISYSKVFAKVAVGLDKQPELIQHLIEESMNDEGQRESLPEKAANVVRQAFIICLNDRNTVPGGIRDGKPDGKKVGIYKMANICLRILLQADKPESCETIFRNIMNSSPPLRIYPASERVTFLYYLGRYQFANTQFYSAQLVLQEAWEHCSAHSQCFKQRRLILVYLVASNLILGRFPTENIYQLQEARGFRDAFMPLTQAIRKGDLETFRRITNLDLTHQSADFLLHYRIFYQIGNYCEVLVWRSLARKVFLLAGQQVLGAVQNTAGKTEQKASSLDLNALLHAFLFFERRAKIKNPAMAAQDQGPGRRNFGHLFFDHESTTKSTYIDPDFAGVEGLEPYNHEIDLLEMECICGSLITQGFLNGYISQKSMKVAVQGANKPGGVRNGFPPPWEVIKSKNSDDVQGWKKEGGSTGLGQVVHLSNARAAGE